MTAFQQAKSPGSDNEPNWLPIPPSGMFNLTTRVYQPKEEMLDGAYNLPPVTRAQSVQVNLSALAQLSAGRRRRVLLLRGEHLWRLVSGQTAAVVRLVAVLLATVLLLPAARAHESRPAYLEVKETAPGQFSVLWRTPVLAGKRLPLVLQMPGDVRNLKEPVVQELADSLVERRWIDAGPKGLAGRRIEIAGLQFTITDALVRFEMLDGRNWTVIARPSRPWAEMAAEQTWLETAGAYVMEGVRHILYGPDHLLFVLGLMLIVKGRWMLLKTVTAFTVAHSITLAMATFGSAQVPAAPLNAAIALSILFLGPEIVRAWRGETSFTLRHPWVVAFAFGLLHGFAFASALTGAGLPRQDLPLALVSFNLGVELGQLGFIAVVLAALRTFSVLQIRWKPWVRFLPGYVIGSIGAFWTLERVAVLVGLLR